MSVALPPIEAVVPHRGAMLWLERLVSGDERGVEAEARVGAGAWYLDEAGAMPAWLGIELMAQALAAHVGLRAWASGQPARPGVLLGCRAYRSRAARFPRGETLRVTALRSFSDESGFAAYDCAIAGAGGEIAAATLKAYEPPDFAAFLASVETQ
jgi:predicted hotdog family 3-hydroxylacyl-ACP dehydratase